MRLKGKSVPRSSGARFPDNAMGEEVDAQALISQELTEFRDMDECLLQNDRLLKALRSVSHEADHNKALVAQEIEQRMGQQVRIARQRSPKIYVSSYNVSYCLGCIPDNPDPFASLRLKRGRPHQGSFCTEDHKTYGRTGKYCPVNLSRDIHL